MAFKTWLLPLKIFRIEDHILKITAPFEQAVTYIENKYKTFLYVAVAEAMGEEYEIKIITEEEAEKERITGEEKKADKVRKMGKERTTGKGRETEKEEEMKKEGE